MTNQEKFIHIFGIDAWQQMIVFSGLAEQFKEYWTSAYKGNEEERKPKVYQCGCGTIVMNKTAREVEAESEEYRC